jgi:hypothetical protein
MYLLLIDFRNCSEAQVETISKKRKSSSPARDSRRAKAPKAVNKDSNSGSHTPVGEDWELACEICRHQGINLVRLPFVTLFLLKPTNVRMTVLQWCLAAFARGGSISSVTIAQIELQAIHAVSGSSKNLSVANAAPLSGYSTTVIFLQAQNKHFQYPSLNNPPQRMLRKSSATVLLSQSCQPLSALVILRTVQVTPIIYLVTEILHSKITV